MSEIANTTDLWRDALERAAAAGRAIVGAGPKPDAGRAYDATAIARSAFAAMSDWTARPQDLFAMQARAWSEWTEFWTAAWRGEPASPEIPRGDRRFSHRSWQEEPAFRALRDGYLLAARQLRRLVAETGGVDPSAKAMLGFLADQYLNAVAPTNFPMTNPEAVERTIETKGANLVSGFANLLEDLSAGHGIVRRRSDPGAFVKGETIAATPGGVVFQNHLFQLIQYAPETADVAAEPLLYVPPLVNRYYMIDLQPRSSLVKWLVAQGRTVFVISWVNPDERHRDCDVAAYVRDGIGAALGEVERITDAKPDLFGFCLGGTLIGVALAWLAAKGEAERVRSATLIGSMVDFSDMRDWSAFVHEAHLDALDAHLEKRGFVDSLELQQLFSAVRANDLVWSSVVNHYLLDRAAPPSDLLTWFEDGARIPQGFLRSYNRELLYGNRLSEPAGFAVDGHALDLGAIRTPVLSVALKDDHVSAWEAVYKGARLLGGATEFILGGSGHNAGVINPPAANKHGYWRNPALPENADMWLEGAEKHAGSWWPAWLEWLDGLPAAGKRPARQIEGAIEPAPGSYAMMD